MKYATPATPSRHGRGGSESNELRLIGQHFPAYVENTDSLNLKKKILDDALNVINMEHVKKRFICKQCDQGLCSVQCLALKSTTL